MLDNVERGHSQRKTVKSDASVEVGEECIKDSSALRRVVYRSMVELPLPAARALRIAEEVPRSSPIRICDMGCSGTGRSTRPLIASVRLLKLLRS